MTSDDLKALDTGDIIRGKLSGRVYVVTANYGDRVTAVDTADVTHADEWEIVRKAITPDSSEG